MRTPRYRPLMPSVFAMCANICDMFSLTPPAAWVCNRTWGCEFDFVCERVRKELP